jgi:hypothetical protein
MDAFGYLAVLISIVLGLGITNLLIGVALLVRRRHQVRLFWPAPFWISTLFLVHVQTWWAMFGLRSVVRWNFAAFLIVLLQPVLLFLMAALIAPDLADALEPIDTRAAYFHQARWFFGALLLALVVSVSKDVVVYGRLPERDNLIAHAIFMMIAATGLLVRREGVHKVLAPLGLLLISVYIGLLFTTLS